MSTFTTKDNIKLHYDDTRTQGRPVVLIHGWPMSGKAFARNIPVIANAGYRVIAYDRRGFGDSDKPENGYDYDTLASDLDDLMNHLDLKDAVILGFSMGGGEVARYCGKYGTKRLAGVVLSGSICPALCITEDNPDGAMPISGFQEISAACAADHPGFLDQFTTWFFSNNDGLAIPEITRQEALKIALKSSPKAAAETVMIWATDLREDCRKIDVPTLVMHGDGDQNVPLAASSERAAKIIPNAQLKIIEGGAHGMNLTHSEKWNSTLLEFLKSL
ncbi:MAG: alpha/beta hydrolase [Propionibacterium sp.]|nr:MAG: alpha/beta hydrolase [Propionibacterium sp.]